MITLAWPYCLLLFLVPWIVHAVCTTTKKRASGALKIPFFEAIASDTATSSSFSRRSFAWYGMYVLWCLLVLALSNPQWVGPPLALAQRGHSMMLAIDISGSMEIPDLEWDGQAVNRLTAVKHIAKNFIKQRAGDRMGLILFGTFSYLQTPLTFDRSTVQKQLKDASIGLAGPQTAIGDAIALSVKQFMKQKDKTRILILLSDGANNSGVIPPRQALTLAKQHGIRIYTIGLGSDHLKISSVFGPQLINPSSDLDEALLKEIAQQTGGLYFRAKDTMSLTSIYQQIDQLEPLSKKTAVFRRIDYLYPWPLGLALLLSVVYVLRYLYVGYSR